MAHIVSAREAYKIMNKLIFLAIIIGVVIGIKEILVSNFFGAQKTFVKRSEYKKRDFIMDKREMAFFHELERQLPEGYYIFPKMRIIDMIDATQGEGLRYRKNKIMPKHVDFIICNSYFNPILAIELNGNSHYRQDRIDSDDLKTKVFEVANLPLEIVNVGTDFKDSVLRIKSLI